MKSLLRLHDVFSVKVASADSESRRLLPTERYLVINTAFTGGGTGHGPGDVYPGGHYVTATRIGSKKKASRTFYMTGCFNNMIDCKNITLLGKAEMKIAKIVSVET
jgi:hypothetical protein